ncbi:Uncharacterized protein HZ326_23880 [Fusarium oxysporum f. sp. albedinis]|nr:Uncharacterized protein HZ326_29224 [Fusarium oxysporum f. sp. albedinis]KAJ0133051.1 Uncharacterized protein HZ326_23880 [Fusarium oxysporum f. sp. albedinis]
MLCNCRGSVFSSSPSMPAAAAFVLEGRGDSSDKARLIVPRIERHNLRLICPCWELFFKRRTASWKLCLHRSANKSGA